MRDAESAAEERKAELLEEAQRAVEEAKRAMLQRAQAEVEGEKQRMMQLVRILARRQGGLFRAKRMGEETKQVLVRLVRSRGGARFKQEERGRFKNEGRGTKSRS